MTKTLADLPLAQRYDYVGRRGVRTGATIIAVACLAVSSGCAPKESDTNQPISASDNGYITHVQQKSVMLNDGRTVTCLMVSIGHGGGIDCDWGNAK